MAAPGVAMSNPLHPRFDDADADVPTSAHPPQTPAVGAADDASAEHADDVPNPPPPPPPRQRSALLLLAVAVAVALPVSNAAQLYAHSDSLVTLELRGHDGRAASYHKGWKTGLAADGSGSDPSVLQFLEDGCAARGNVSALLEAAFPAMWLPAATRPFALRALLWGKTGRLARGGGGGDRSDKQPPRMCFWAAVAYVPAGILVWWVFFFNAYFYGRLCELPSFANGAGVAMQAGAPLDAAYNATQLPYFAFDADGHAALEHVSSHVNLHASAFFGLLLDTGVAVCLAFYAHVLASPCAASSPQRAASTARAGASQVLLYARGIAVVLVPLALTGVLANSSRNYVVYAVEQLRAAPTLSGAAAAATTTADDLSAVPAGNPLPHVVFQGLSFATSVWTDTALYAVPTWRFAPSADANTSLSLLPDGGGFGSGGDIACSNPAGILVLLQLTVFAAFPLSVLAAFHSWYAALGPWHGRHGFVPTAAVPLATVAAMAAVHAVVLHSADCTDAAGQAVSPSATRHPCPLLWATAVYAGVLLADAICVLGNAAGAAAALPAYATLAEAEAASAEDVAGRENGAAAGAEEGGSQQLELSSGVTEEAR